MKKTIIALFLCLTMWVYWHRSFYCLDDKRCITVWETFNNICLIIPERYYGFFWPSENYIKTLNTNDVVIYWSKDLPANSFIVRCTEGYQIINNEKGFIIFDYYKDLKLQGIIYTPESKLFNEIKENADLMDINIKENYVVDKKGVKL